MLPLLARIRERSTAPWPRSRFRTGPTEASPTMESLRADGVNRVFPLALDPFSCTRFEMADFAAAARDLGVNYVGICCGGGPHHVRAMAEALGPHGPGQQVLTGHGPASGPGHRGLDRHGRGPGGLERGQVAGRLASFLSGSQAACRSLTVTDVADGLSVTVPVAW